MKKLLKNCTFLLILLITLHVNSANAQDETMTYGPQIKVGVYDWIGNDAPNIDLQSGFQFAAGGFFRYNIIELVSVKAEVGYMNASVRNLEVGASSLTFNNQISQVSSLRLHSIETAILAEVNLPLDISILPNIIIGPSFNYNYYASARNEYLLSGADNNAFLLTTSSVENDKINDLEIALNAGLLYNLELMGFNTSVDVRYRLGLTPISSYPFRSPFAKEVYSSSIMATLSVGLPF